MKPIADDVNSFEEPLRIARQLFDCAASLEADDRLVGNVTSLDIMLLTKAVPVLIKALMQARSEMGHGQRGPISKAVAEEMLEMQRHRDSMRAELDEARAVIAWYADERNYNADDAPVDTSVDDDGDTYHWPDLGDHARDYLANVIPCPIFEARDGAARPRRGARTRRQRQRARRDPTARMVHAAVDAGEAQAMDTGYTECGRKMTREVMRREDTGR